MSIFSDIREACAQVALSASWLEMDIDRALLYPEKLELGKARSLSHSDNEHLVGKGDDSLRFFVLLDSVNFGSGYFPFIDKGQGLSGYFTVAGRLKDHVLREGIPSPERLAATTPDDCAAIFRQPMDNPHARELMTLFAFAWRELATWTLTRFGGDYLGFLRASSSADEAVRSLCQMAPYRDVSTYFGREVPFLKRAQILLQDMSIADPAHPLLQFPDLDDLTVFADNILPYVFRSDGLIKCHPWLEGRIEREELIAQGSAEEIELRACSVYLAEIIGSVINDELLALPMRHLDFVLWNRGQELKRGSPRKRHRSRSMFY